jgi:hypothetical protein
MARMENDRLTSPASVVAMGRLGSIVVRSADGGKVGLKEANAALGAARERDA